jgi:hypothetical protein
VRLILRETPGALVPHAHMHPHKRDRGQVGRTRRRLRAPARPHWHTDWASAARMGVRATAAQARSVGLVFVGRQRRRAWQRRRPPQAQEAPWRTHAGKFENTAAIGYYPLPSLTISTISLQHAVNVRAPSARVIRQESHFTSRHESHL